MSIFSICIKHASNASLEVHIFIYMHSDGLFFIVNPLALCAESSVSPRQFVVFPLLSVLHCVLQQDAMRCLDLST